MKYPHSVEGRIKLVSKEPLTEKPDFATVGGFAVKQADGTDIVFDWEQYAGDSFTTEDGKIGIDFRLSGFDSEFFQSGNEGMRDPNWHDIVNSTLDEVSYEVGYIDKTNAETAIQMEVVSFGVGELKDDFSAEKWLMFPETEIAAYNARENDRFKADTPSTDEASTDEQA